MGIKFSLVAVLTLILLVFLGVKSAHLEHLFGVYIPYAAVCVFFLGFIYRVLTWARSPVPFRIPTTGGQQFSLPWVKHSQLDNPSTTAATIGRMLLEILVFRSLFRNTKMELHAGPKITYQWEKWLWLAGLAFHYAFLVIFIRHLRFFTEPIPFFVSIFEKADSVMQVGLPLVYLSDLVLVAAVSYLFIRRVVIPQMRYISLAADYFPLLLILALAITGILMRYFIRIDVTSVKDHESGGVPPGGAQGSQHPVLHPLLFDLRPVRLFPLQQADAPRWDIPQSDTQSAQRHPYEAARESVELPCQGSHI
jgi:nitrate reductase gamma subunit